MCARDIRGIPLATNLDWRTEENNWQIRRLHPNFFALGFFESLNLFHAHRIILMKIFINNLTVSHGKCMLTVLLLFFGLVTNAKAQSTDIVRATVVAQQKFRDAQAKAQSLASTAETINSIFSDINRMDDSIERDLQSAIAKRQECLSQQNNNLEKNNRIFCPQEPRSLKLLNEQLFTQMKLKRLGSIGVARAVLCLSSDAVKGAPFPKDLLIKLTPDQTILFKEAVDQAKHVINIFNKTEKSALSEKCESSNFGSKGDEFTFSSTLGQISRNAVSIEAYQVVSKNCGYNIGLLNTNLDVAIREALNNCRLIDKYDAKTDIDAAKILETLRRDDLLVDSEAWKDANTRMLNYTSYVYRFLTPMYLQRYAPQCKDGSSINWSESNPWRISFDCFFGPSEYHYFNPFPAPGELKYSASQELKKPVTWPYPAVADPVESRSLAWMTNFIRSHTTARKAFFDECARRTSQVPRPQKSTFHSIEGNNLTMTCQARGVPLLQVSHVIDSQGTISQQARFSVNKMLPTQ